MLILLRCSPCRVGLPVLQKRLYLAEDVTMYLEYGSGLPLVGVLSLRNTAQAALTKRFAYGGWQGPGPSAPISSVC